MEENILSLAPSLLYCPAENSKAVKAVRHMFSFLFHSVFPDLPWIPSLSLSLSLISFETYKHTRVCLAFQLSTGSNVWEMALCCDRKKIYSDCWSFSNSRIPKEDSCLFVLKFKVLVQPKRNIWSSFINRVPKPRRISFFLGTYKEKDSSLRRSFPYNEKIVLTTRRCNLLNMYAKFGPSSCQFYRRGNVVHFDMDVVCPWWPYNLTGGAQIAFVF